MKQVLGGALQVKWNLTRNVKKFQHADILVLSIGKSGRTWLRVLLNKYIAQRCGLDFGLGDLSRLTDTIPSICYSHELWEHFSKAGLSQRWLGKYIIPDRLLFKKKVILLFRDPRDILVSLYFHKTRRSVHKIQMDLDAFMRNRKDGIERIVAVLNTWRRRLASHPRCYWISYESLKADTTGRLADLVRFIGLEPINHQFVQTAVAFAAFNNMKQMEARGVFESEILKPSDPNDPNSFKVREGKVGGYRRHFNEQQLRYLDHALARLDPFFGYTPLT